MKKQIVYILFIFNVIFYEMNLIIGTDMLAEYYFYGNETEPDYLAAFFLVTVLILVLMVINYLNLVYDRIAGFAGKRKAVCRWTRSTMFYGLVTVFVIFMIEISLVPSGNLRSEGRSYQIIFGFAAVIAAIWMYAKNYKKTKDVGARINDLRKENVLQAERRYTLLIEQMKDAEDDSVKIEGFVHGEMHAGDQVYTVYPNNPELLCRIKTLSVGGEKVRNAKNSMVTLTVKGLPQNLQLPAYTVLTDIHPYKSELQTGINNVENPYLTGLLMEYSRFYREPKYFNMVVYEVCHAKYLIAGTAQGNKRLGDMMDVLSNQTDVGFPSVSQTGRKEQMLPIFTDWEALKNWKDVVNGDRSVTLIMDFQQLLPILRNGFSGMVIDPFGPRPFALTQELVESIISSEGYRKEFVLKQSEREKQ